MSENSSHRHMLDEPWRDSHSSTCHPRRYNDNAVKAPTGPPPITSTFLGRDEDMAWLVVVATYYIDQNEILIVTIGQEMTSSHVIYRFQIFLFSQIHF